jgi:hypothetical protein
MSAVRYFLTGGPGTLDADYRAWLARHPGVFWTGRIIVLTVAVLLGSLVAVIVLPLLPVWLFIFVGGWAYLNHRARERRELLTALRKR